MNSQMPSKEIRASLCLKNMFLGFLQDRRGIVSVEFSLIVPVFILVLAFCLGAARVQIATMLLERSVYDIAHQAKVAQGENFEAIVQTVLDRRNNGVFKPETVNVTATWSTTLAQMAAGGFSGAGGASDIVCLRLEANMGLFGALLGEEKAKNVQYAIDYCYVNEPDLEAVN